MIFPGRDVPELLGALARLPAERPALTFYRGRTRVGGLTYGQLLSAVDGFTRRLRDDLGVAPGERIAVLTPNRLEVPALLLAAMRLGAAVVPLNPTASPEEWAYILDHAEPRVLYCGQELRPRVVRPPDAVRVFEDEPPFRTDAPVTSASSGPGPWAKQMAIVLYTSGTTGNPKGVALAQESLLANAVALARNFDLRGETQLAVLPLYHAHALGFGLLTSLVTGGHLVFTERFDPFAWSDIIRAESVGVTSVVPTLLQPLLQLGVRADKIPSLRALLVSSAPLSVDLARRFEEETGLRLYQGWGLSEYSNFACCLSLALGDEERRRLLYGGELTSVGAPLPGTEVRVVGADGAPLPAGARGELIVRGRSTMLGYFRDDAATAAALAPDGWLRTGDEGYFRAEAGGPAFFITGRIKEIIIRDGDKLSPLAIERRILADLPQIEGRFVALGFPHDLHGEEIGLYLEGADLDAELRARLADTVAGMPPGARPKVVLYGAAAIPRTHTGKIQRRKLHAAFAPFRSCRGALQIERADS
jgi:long-chain acyl-CoA synthetase